MEKLAVLPTMLVRTPAGPIRVLRHLGFLIVAMGKAGLN